MSDEELLTAIRESSAPAVSARAVADEVPLTQRSVHRRLMELTENGTLETDQFGNSARVWWLP